MKRGVNKKSQLTLYIIIALVIIAFIILFFTLRNRAKPGEINVINAEEYIDKCMRDSAEEAVEIMLPQGGYLSPSNYKLYNNTKVAYLCKMDYYYAPCINLEPMYIEHLESEIKNYSQSKVDRCFVNLESQMGKRGYDSSFEGGGELKVELNPNQIQVDADKKLTLEKNGQTTRYENFSVSFANPIYDLAIISVEIVNYEAEDCEFHY